MFHPVQTSPSCPATDPPTLFLPGWAFDGRIVKLINPVPGWIYPDDMPDPRTMEQVLLDHLKTMESGKVRLIGWSMGGLLGLNFAARHPDLIESLVLISCRSRWPGSEIGAIRTEFLRDPAAFLKGFYRKCFLGAREPYADFKAGLESLYLREIKKNTGPLLRGLDFLAGFEVPRPLPDIPIRLIHGRQDIVAPLGDMLQLEDADREIIDAAGHLPFLHEACSLRREIKKQAVRLRFSRAAASYDNYALVQAEVARRLTAKLPGPTSPRTVGTILEIGCGTGNFTSLLAARFPTAEITALDFSPEMLAVARHKLDDPRINCICAEGESFLRAGPENSFDLVVSNGALQWFTDIGAALHHTARLLTPGGSMHCSIFGPQSLKELAHGLEAVQTLKAPLAARTFPGPAELRQVLADSFRKHRLQEEYIEKEYRSAPDLLRHIRKTGTGGWRQKLLQPLTSSRLKRLDQWFIETHGSCRVTYQIFFLQGQK